MAKADIYMVIADFVTTIDGDEVEYHKGEVVEADDPAVKLLPMYFGPLVFRHRRPLIEQATAGPGEKRGV